MSSTDRQTDRRTDGQTDKVNPVYPPSNFVGRGYNDGLQHWHIYASPSLNELTAFTFANEQVCKLFHRTKFKLQELIYGIWPETTW